MAALKKRYYQKIDEEVYSAILDSGMSLSIIKKKGFVEKAAFLSTNFGALDNHFYIDGELQSYPAGIAHFLEHKLFEDEQGRDVTLDFVKLGADVNAFTTLEKTIYYFSTLDNFEESLELLLNFTSSFTSSEDAVNHEKRIIEQEINMYQDDPDSCLFFKTLANLYPATPLASDIVGTEDSIEDISLEDLRDNFDEFYTPVNSQIFLVGNFDLELIQNYFLQKDVGGCIVQNPKELIALHPVKKVESIRMDVASPKLAIGVRTNSDMGHQDCYRYSVLLRALFTMMFGWTSKRFQSLYETGKLDSSLSLEIEINRRFNFLMLTMDTKEPVAISHQFRKAIQNFATDSDVSEEHLDLIKSEIYGEFIHSMNSLEFIATQYQSHSDETTLFDLPKIIQEMTLDDVLEVGHHFIDNSEIVEFTIFPL
mgnify:CR=1 FL=1